jgi:hypothetical protein
MKTTGPSPLIAMLAKAKDRTFMKPPEWKPLRGYVNPVTGRTLVAGLIAWCVGATVFFHFAALSAFQLIIGDIADTRQMIFLHEHLFHALTGNARFVSPPYLYPYPHMLGLADAFVLDLLPYAALRSLGFDQFLAYQLMIIALSLLCFMTGLVLCVRYLKLRPTLAICAATLMTFPNNLYFKVGGGHVQFFSLYYIPAIVLLALWALEDFACVTPWSILRAASAAILLALLFATSFYTAWFFAFTVIIAACVFITLRTRIVVNYAGKNAASAATLGGTAGAAFILGLIPFALIYFPALTDFPGRSWIEYRYGTGFPQDIVNVSPWNLAWGWLMSRLPLKPSPEFALAVTPGMVAILIALVYVHRKSLSRSSALHWQVAFGFCCILTGFLAWLFTSRIAGYSAFWIVREVVPGAMAIRNGTRIMLVVNLWIALGVAVLLQYWIDTAPVERRKRRRLTAGAAMVFCLFEQLNVMDNAKLPRDQELERLASVPSPPPQCRAFLVNRRQQEPSASERRRAEGAFDRANPLPLSEPQPYIDGIDALGIALKVGLPTLNGSSPWPPQAWHLGDRDVDYFEAGRQWIAATGLKEQVCLYDRSARQWSNFS